MLLLNNWPPSKTDKFNLRSSTEPTSHQPGCTGSTLASPPHAGFVTELKGIFFYIFWSCPEIQSFWGAVGDVITAVAHISFAPSPKTCLLGLVEDLTNRTPIELLLFYARKVLTLHWKKPLAPTITFLEATSKFPASIL